MTTTHQPVLTVDDEYTLLVDLVREFCQRLDALGRHHRLPIPLVGLMSDSMCLLEAIDGPDSEDFLSLTERPLAEVIDMDDWKDQRQAQGDTMQPLHHSLEGEPIPEDWTKNSGATLRPLEIGMEIRYKSDGPSYPVMKVTASGAIVRGTLRQVTVRGRTFATHGPPIQIALLSEVEYRRKREPVWEGLDVPPQDVVESFGKEGNRALGGTKHMAKNTATAPAVSAAPIPKGKGKAALKTTKAPAKAKAAGASKANGAVKAKREAKPKEMKPCLCGCGGMTASYFVPGHDARFKGWLTKIQKGKAKPKELLPEAVVKAMGPWTPSGDGLVPTKGYRDIPR